MLIKRPTTLKLVPSVPLPLQTCKAKRFVLPDGAEKDRVVAAFQKSLKIANISIQVVNVERIQNYPMWQSFAVKKISVINREKGYDSHANPDKFVRKWLFHGTNAEVLPKIIAQGFNRSFCGKNATFYGKGMVLGSVPWILPPNHRLLSCRILRHRHGAWV
jgi:hypothetical protein